MINFDHLPAELQFVALALMETTVFTELTDAEILLEECAALFTGEHVADAVLQVGVCDADSLKARRKILADDGGDVCTAAQFGREKPFVSRLQIVSAVFLRLLSQEHRLEFAEPIYTVAAGPLQLGLPYLFRIVGQAV